MNIAHWKTKGLAAILTVSTLALPQAVSAQERSGRGDPYYGAYQSRYYPQYEGGYGYAQPPVQAPGSYLGYYQYGYGREGYRDNHYRGDDYRFRRSPERSAAIVGGSAAAGAIFGALAGGGKGAAIGAAVGGIGGLIFDQSSRDRYRH